jgi:AraC-like DNA-binding protein
MLLPSPLSQAATESLARIRRHRRRAPNRVRPLLAYLEEHLFDPGLTVERWCRECGVRDSDVLRQLTVLVGLTPYAYVEDLRLETACRLLADTAILIREVAAMVGYGHVRVFGRAFVRWSGVRPGDYRRQGEPRRPPRPLTLRDQEALLGEALALADRALELARSTGDREVVADVLIRKAKILSRAGDPAGIALLEEALALARE